MEFEDLNRLRKAKLNIGCWTGVHDYFSTICSVVHVGVSQEHRQCLDEVRLTRVHRQVGLTTGCVIRPTAMQTLRRSGRRERYEGARVCVDNCQV